MAPLALIHAVARATPAGATIVRRDDLAPARGVRTFFQVRGRQELLRPARRRHRLGPAGRDRRQAGAAAAGRSSPSSATAAPCTPCQALWTAAHDSVPVVFVIFNNASYRILKQRTLALKGFSAEDDVYVGMDLDKPLIDSRRPREVARRAGRADREGVRGRPGDGPRAGQRRAVPDRRAHRPALQVSRFVSWPFAELLGMRPKSIGDGRARFELDVTPQPLNPNGTPARRRDLQPSPTPPWAPHLPASSTRGQWCSTLEIKMNYLLPVTAGGDRRRGGGRSRAASASACWRRGSSATATAWVALATRHVLHPGREPGPAE